MTATEFHAEKLDGSVWQFKPTALALERITQFHEPRILVDRYPTARLETVVAG